MMRPRQYCRIAVMALGTLMLLVDATRPVHAVEPDLPVVARETTDRHADLFKALIVSARYDDARSLANARLVGASPNSTQHRRWTANLVRLDTAEATATGPLSDEDLSRLQAPLLNMLASPLDTADELLIRFESLHVLRQACLHDCVTASTAAPESEIVSRAVARVAKLTSESEALIAALQRELTRLESDVAAPAARARDLDEAAQQLRVHALQSLLMLSDVFSEGSADQKDAATKAARLAESSLPSLKPQSLAWTEIQLLRIEALLRAGQMDQADAWLRQLPASGQGRLATRLQEIQLRIALATEDWSAAKEQLEHFFGDSPSTAPRSFDMDLARLRYLLKLASLDDERLKALNVQREQLDPAILAWVDAIETRNGPYERRRAEAMVLRQLGRQGKDETTPSAMLQPALIASQGEDWLRRGDLQRAGELLAAAAIAEADGDRAVSYATKAAAAYVANDEAHPAASVLYQVAMKHPGDHDAAPLALQAAILLHQTGDPDYQAQVDPMLRSLLEHWPDAPPTAGARQWLVDRLTRQERWIEAAEAGSSLPEGARDETALSALVALWQQASRRVPVEQLQTLSERFRAVCEPLRPDQRSQPAYVQAAAFALSREDLRKVHSLADAPATDNSAETSLALALIRFRKTLTLPPELRAIPEQQRDVIEVRLMRDAQLDRACREPIAKAIESWPGSDAPSLDRVQRLAWLERVDEAIAVAHQLLRDSERRGQMLTELAMLFDSSDESRLQRQAIAWWDQLASGLPRGEPRWHEAKLRAAEALNRVGDRDEAVRRARYVLLTQAPADEFLLQRYRSLAAEATE